MFVLVALSITLCTINFVYLLLEGSPVKLALSHTIVLLVASIPLAIEIVTTTTLAIGSKNLVKHGAIVAKLSAIEDLAGMCILCSDKTGTLTLNQMVLQDDTPIYYKGETQWSVLVKAALAARWHEPARDALDRLTLGSVDYKELEHYEQSEYVPFDPTTKRTEGTVTDKRTGKSFKTSKGAPHIIMKLLVEDDPSKDAVEADVARLGECGIRSLAVAFTDPDTGIWHMAGLLTFLDPPRPDTKQTLHDARELGVQIKMITGDHLLIARNTSMQLDLGQFIFGAEKLPMLDMETKEKPADLGEKYGDMILVADGFAQVFPEHKYLIVECLRELGYTTGMTGDGVNDAPALKRADVGIAVAGSTDAARAAADIVFTQDGLSAIVHGIVIAREIFARMCNFITYRISATLQLLVFFFVALFLFSPHDYDEAWPHHFHMPVLMLMLITVLNDGTLITIAYDYAKASRTPDRWNIPALFVVSSVLGFVSMISSLLLLYFLLDSNSDGSFLGKLGLSDINYGHITSAIYLKVSVSDFLTLFSARTGEKFFFQIRPAPLLLAGGVIALSISSILAIVWPKSTPDGIETEGLKAQMGLFLFVWIFCIIWWFVQDIAKVLCWKLLYRINFNKIGSTGVVVLSEKTLAYKAEMEKYLNDPNAAKGH
jgi:H+-transporting ATPase